MERANPSNIYAIAWWCNAGAQNEADVLLLHRKGRCSAGDNWTSIEMRVALKSSEKREMTLASVFLKTVMFAILTQIMHDEGQKHYKYSKIKIFMGLKKQSRFWFQHFQALLQHQFLFHSLSISPLNSHIFF